MRLDDARQLAEHLIAHYGLIGWSFRFNKNKRRLGVCRQTDKRIELSEHYVLLNRQLHIQDTILHEIAHALVGTEHGHDDVWRAKCIEIGCSPKACDNEAEMPQGSWQARCPSCKTIFARHRKPRPLRGRYCVACGPDRGRLIFRDVREMRRERPTFEPVAASQPPVQPVATPSGPRQLLIKLFG